jgi:hypothetical protein
MIRTDLHFSLIFLEEGGFRNNAQSISTEEPILSTGEATYDYRNSSVEVLGIYQYNIKNSIKVGFNVFDENMIISKEQKILAYQQR